jgi:hypothetical protein
MYWPESNIIEVLTIAALLKEQVIAEENKQLQVNG